MSAAGKPTPVQREKFRKFVERSGIMELVTKALVDLYEEQLQEPEDALEFFKTKICVNSNKEVDAAKARIYELEAKIAMLQLSEQNASSP